MSKFKTVLNWLLARLKEKTTWAAIITFVSTSLGVQFAPEQAQAITSLGLSVVTAIAVFSEEKPKT